MLKAKLHKNTKTQKHSSINDKQLGDTRKMERKTIGYINLFDKVNEITIENHEISVKKIDQKSDDFIRRQKRAARFTSP